MKKTMGQEEMCKLCGQHKHDNMVAHDEVTTRILNANCTHCPIEEE